MKKIRNIFITCMMVFIWSFGVKARGQEIEEGSLVSHPNQFRESIEDGGISPFNALPIELRVEILSYLPSSQLQDMIYVCHGFEEARIGALSKRFQTLIKNSEDLDSFLIGINPYKLSRLVIQFSLTGGQLRKLIDSTNLNFFIPAPAFEMNGVESTKKLLSIPNCNLQFVHNEGDLLWSLAEIKQLWDSLKETEENKEIIHKKIIMALTEFMYEISLNQLQPTLNRYPFLTNISVGDIDAEDISILIHFIAQNRLITSLDLGDNDLSSEEMVALIEALKFNTVLRSLNLEDNNMGNLGAVALAEVLKVDQILTSLNLENNKIGDLGAIALAEALSVNTTLTELELMGNRIGEEGREALLRENKRGLNLILYPEIN
ncbi:MAG: hypothetical protein K0M45_03340 [Candidatus Paracaedibacteraceae bacterium]|nr:hypothetical protein [Candidatus Paracaedibacteraceae bacterium]